MLEVNFFCLGLKITYGDYFLVRSKAYRRCVPVGLIFPATPAINLRIQNRKTG